MAKYIYTNGTKSITFPQYPNSAWDFATEAPEDPASLYGIVAAIFRAMNLNAEAVANLPFAVMRGENEIDNSDDWKNEVGFMQNPRELFRLWRLSLAMHNRAYGFMEGNRVIKNLRYIVPTTITPLADINGLTGFKRQLGTVSTQYSLKDKRIFWMFRLDHTTELLPSENTEYRAMAAAGGILYYADYYVQSFLKRGGIKPTMLMVKGVPSREEREKIESIWDKVIHGWYKYLGKVFNAESITAVPIGEGIENTKDTDFAESKISDIALASGIPLSLLLANSANYATAATEYMSWFRDSVVPWARFMEDCMNDQLFTPLGLHFEFRPEVSDPGQEDEVSRASAYQSYVSAGMLPSIAAQVVGIELPPGVEYSALDPVEEPEEEPEPEPEVENGEEEEVEEEGLPIAKFIPSVDQFSEMELWRTMAFRHLKRGESLAFEFEAKTIPADVADTIRRRLEVATNQDEIKSSFEDLIMPSDIEIKRLADAINKAASGGGSSTVRFAMPDIVMQMPEVKQPNIVVNVPETVVNISMPKQEPPQVTVSMPEMPAPIVNVAAPEVNITNQPANVTVKIPPTPAPQSLRVQRDAAGQITGIEKR